jgi:hypothetical protein
MPYNKTTSAADTIFISEPEKVPSFLKSAIWLLIFPLLILWGINFALGFIMTILLRYGYILFKTLKILPNTVKEWSSFK